jgi:hypothetical protein
MKLQKNKDDPFDPQGPKGGGGGGNTSVDNKTHKQSVEVKVSQGQMKREGGIQTSQVSFSCRSSGTLLINN